MTRLDISLNLETKVSEENKAKFLEALHRLTQFEPIQYIIGSTEFYGLSLKVNNYTLIPRPETEALVHWILEDLKEMNLSSSYNILDIGTGSGCIAIALATKLQKVKVSAIDISERALKVAKLNAINNNVAIEFEQKNILNTESLSEEYNVIVSNPPYVRESEKRNMNANVLNHEPATALYVSDENPLVFYTKIAQIASTHLKNNGSLYFEINEYLSTDVVNMLKSEGFSEVEIRKDLFGKERMIKAKLHA